MHGLYAKLQDDCKIGPFMMKDGQKVLKPFEEYPKWVTKADGKRVIVKDLREEALMAVTLQRDPRMIPLRANARRWPLRARSSMRVGGSSKSSSPKCVRSSTNSAQARAASRGRLRRRNRLHPRSPLARRIG